ncbi:component of the polarisome [Pestalotiopsis sp. 9143b]|nr:component of the polarisome [Pestalotiopsis sp. 9143b]
MNSRNAPLSPVSVGGSEYSVGKYQSLDNGDPYNNRAPISPPDSGGANPMMNGFPGSRSVGGPSPPPSVARSSTASGLYAASESGKSVMRDDENVVTLGVHYVALKKFLQSTSKDGRANPPPNRARDKLLRLSAVQFLELSTDVYDELLRRERLSRSGANGPKPPPFLQPEDNFHPKRNQARQKLSTLGPPRFRDLATDVFCELERRFEGFARGDIPRVGSPVSVRSGTPGMNGLPPRGMRRPSNASSIRSDAPRFNDYPIPPSPSMPPNGFDRPQPKQFQSNMIVPNKSTMLEEDDDGDGLDDRQRKRSSDTGISETDKRLLEESQAQVLDLQAKLDDLENQYKKKDDELNKMIEEERSRSSNDNAEKAQWDGVRADLENQLAQAKSLSDTLRDNLDRMREDHDVEERQLREQLEEAEAAVRNNMSNRGNADVELQRENDDLRRALEEQQQVTEEVRKEAQQFLQEMKVLSEQHSPAWETQAELHKSVEQLEQEIKDWRNRYARTKTQLRNMRASSLGLTIDQDAAKYVREKGFTEENGLVKDVHVTKFQIAIDELLKRARTDNPDKAIDSMKAVVVAVRRITKDIDASAPRDEDVMAQQQKLKSRVSATANNLITASRNFATAAGISPVSLLDAAASHLVAALVELLRTVKIRATPVGELEDDDDGTMTPVDSTGFFSSRRTTQDEGAFPKPLTRDNQSPLDPPPRFNGLGPRESAQSSAYSPMNSPRESEAFNSRRSMPRNMPSNSVYVDKNPPPPTNYGGQRMDITMEDLKIYMDNQSDQLVETIQGLVASIRSDAPITQINDQIGQIAEIVGKIVSETEGTNSDSILIDSLTSCRERLLEAGDLGSDLVAKGLNPSDREWRMWTQTLPPIAFEIARETKELVEGIGRMVMNDGDDYS